MDLAERGAAPRGGPRRQFGFRTATVVGHVHQVRGQPVAAARLPVVVRAAGDRQHVRGGEVGLQVAECVLARNGPPEPVQLVDPRRIGPGVGQAVPARVASVFGLGSEPLVGGVVGVVVRDVRRQVEPASLGLDLAGEVVPLAAGETLHPVAALLMHRGNPGADLAAEQVSGVHAQVEPLAVVRSEVHRRRELPLVLRIVGGEIERPAERLDGTGGDVRSPLGDGNSSHVGRIHEAVRLGAAPVVRGAVRHAVDRRADLGFVEIDLESAHGNAGGPVVGAVGVPLLDGDAGDVVHHGQHARDRGLLGDHRFRHDVRGEAARLLGHDSDGFHQAADLEHQIEASYRVRLDRDRLTARFEAGQGSFDQVVAGGDVVEREATVGRRDLRSSGRRPGPDQRHRGPGKRAAGRVHHPARDGTRGLGGEERWEKRQERHQAGVLESPGGVSEHCFPHASGQCAFRSYA